MMINLQRQSLQVPSRDVNGGLTSVEFRPEIRTGFVGVLFFFRAFCRNDARRYFGT